MKEDQGSSSSSSPQATEKPIKNAWISPNLHVHKTSIQNQIKQKPRQIWNTKVSFCFAFLAAVSLCVCASEIIRPHLEFKMIELVNKKSDTEKNEWRNDWMNEIERKKEGRKEGKRETRSNANRRKDWQPKILIICERMNEWTNDEVCVHVFVVVFLVNDSFGANMHAC